MSDNYSFGRPTLGRGKPHGHAKPGGGSQVPGSAKAGPVGSVNGKINRPGGSQKAPQVSGTGVKVNRPGGAQKIKS
jgi:hypothetical protein